MKENRSSRFIFNRDEVETSHSPGMVVLDFIRGVEGLTGTKEGCREGECGACTVLIGEVIRGTLQYRAVASCLLPLGELNGKHLVTIEGINLEKPGELTPVQQALVDEVASQCGFCTPGLVVSLTGFFLSSPTLNFNDAIDAVDGNICRCTGYVSICRAIDSLCQGFTQRLAKNADRISQLVDWRVLPGYFLDIYNRLLQLNLPAATDTLSKQYEEQKESRGKNSSALPLKGKIIMAGGTDLYIQQPDALAEADLEFVSCFSRLRGIRRHLNWIYIGAGTTVEELKHSSLINEIYPRLPGYLNLVSSTIMRNRATLAGNIVNASPIGDLSIILLALDADLTLTKDNTRRQFPLRDFFKGYKKLDLEKDEIIESIDIPICPWVGNLYFHFEKVSQRRHLDIASCNSAIYIRTFEDLIEDIHISAGGVAPIPLYLTQTAASLIGKPVSSENIQQAASILKQEISPISDVRGSAQYKSLLLRNLFYTHFITLFPGHNLEKLLLNGNES